MSGSPVASWQPARQHPETYPGACPSSSYLICDDRVHHLAFAEPNALDSAYVIIDGARESVDALLRARGLPSLSDRSVSLAYGANRNPGTLAIKMRNYRYRGVDDGLVLPVLRGAAWGRDVVACGLSGQGYLYADLLVSNDEYEPAKIESWFPLLDDDQLRVMHDGEGVRGGVYSVARFPSAIDGFDGSVDALGYAGNDPVFVSPKLDDALAYSTVNVDRRSLPEMDATEMIDHVLDVGELRPEVSELLQVAQGPSLTAELMAFMNERWWIRFENAAQPDDRYERLLEILDRVVETNQQSHSSAAQMTERGRTLDLDDAYRPTRDLTLGAQLRAGA